MWGCVVAQHSGREQCMCISSPASGSSGRCQRLDVADSFCQTLLIGGCRASPDNFEFATLSVPLPLSPLC